MQPGSLKGRDFLKLLDFTPEEILGLIDLAQELKRRKKAGELHAILPGKNIALIFEKTSTRTRCAFEVAAHDLGMHVTYLDPSGSQIGKKESIADTARVLSRMFDGIEYRGYGQEIVEELAKYSDVPVWNGLTNEFHPTQILADFLTIREHFGSLAGRKFVYMGDARYIMGNSLMIGCAKMGMHFVACAPEDYFPETSLVETAQQIAQKTGAVIELCSDPEQAVKNADVIYTDVWVSMGEPVEVWEERIAALSRYENVKFVLVSPEELKLPGYIKKEILQNKGLEFIQTTDLEAVMPDLDILYMTRVQKERFFNEEDYLRLKDSYILTPQKLESAKEDLCILHPLPRVNEIETTIDSDPRACYFRQAKYGKYIRMALILKLLEVE